MRSKSPIKQKPKKISARALDWLQGNYHVTISLSRTQRALLAQCGRRWGFGKRPCAEALEQLVTLGLSDLPMVERLWQVRANYCMREDLHFTDYVNSLAAAFMGESGAAKKR
jgi:hypothetical protein